MIPKYKDINVITLQDFQHKGDNILPVKDILYSINDILYSNQNKYITYPNSKRLLSQLIEYGKQLKDINIKKKEYKDKQQEILIKLRNVVNSIKNYHNLYPHVNIDALNKAYQQMQNFQVSSYIKSKNELTIDKVFELLKTSKLMYQDAKEDNCTISKAFQKMNEELLQYVIMDLSITEDLNVKVNANAYDVF